MENEDQRKDAIESLSYHHREINDQISSEDNPIVLDYLKDMAMNTNILLEKLQNHEQPPADQAQGLRDAMKEGEG